MNLFLLVIITVRKPLMHVICILFLKVKGIKDRIKSYDFIEGVDFQSFTEIVEREFALVANAPSVNSVKCNRFLFDKVATYNFL